MQTRSIVALFAVVLFTRAAALAASAPDARPSQAAAKVKEDFSTPRAAVETFFAAAAARDADVLSRCFGDGPKEFEPLRKRQLGKADLDHMAAEFGVGKVVSVEQGENAAFVMVKLRSRDEKIEMTRIGNAWKISDF
jgi:hypothetical protein